MAKLKFPVVLDNGIQSEYQISSKVLERMIRRCAAEAGIDIKITKLVKDPRDPIAVWAFNSNTLTGIKFYFGLGFYNNPIVEPASWRNESITQGE